MSEVVISKDNAFNVTYIKVEGSQEKWDRLFELIDSLEVRVLNQQTSVVITTNPIQLTDAVSKTILTTLGSDCIKFGSP